MKVSELPIHIVRVRGIKDGKRTFLDITVHIKENTLNWGKGRFIACFHQSDLVDIAFKSGFDAVTSYNAYNYVADKRYNWRFD